MRQRTHYVPGSVLGDKYMLMSKIWSQLHSGIEILIFKLKITFSKGLSLTVIKCQVPGVHQVRRNYTSEVRSRQASRRKRHLL